MITVNSGYTNLIGTFGLGANIEWQILNGSNTFSIENLIGGTIQSALMDGLTIGNTMSSQLDLTLWGVTPDTSSPLVVQFRANDGDGSTSDWFTKGTFYIDTVEASPYSEEVEITAFDAMLKAEVAFAPTGSWITTTDAAVLDTIADDIGVTVETATYNYYHNSPTTLDAAPAVGINGVTDREMLGYIAALRGGSFIVTAGNQLRLVQPYYGISNTAVVGDAVDDFNASPAQTVKRVKVWKDDTTYFLAPEGYTEEAWEEIGGFCLEVTLPVWSDQTYANNLLTAYNNKTFYPYTATGAYIDPKYEVGDGVSFKTENTVTSRIASQTISLDWLATSGAEFKGEDVLQSHYPYVSQVERQTTYLIGQAQSTAEAAQTAAEGAQASADNANAMEQLVYKSATSGTTTMAAPSSWITNTTGSQNVWTTKRPPYSQSYPVLFVATQRQAVDGTLTCTTPVIDQTTTVIDGGNIITGTITAGAIAAGSLTIGKLDSSTQAAIADGQDALAKAEANTSTLNNLTGYIQAENGVLTLGKVGNEFTTELDNTRLAFKQGDAAVAYLSNSKLYITEAEILTNLQIGHYQWITDSTGRMSLKWVN